MLILNLLIVFSIIYNIYTHEIPGCSSMQCTNSAIETCGLKREYWSFTTIDGRNTCFCCKNERSARIASGINGREQGLYYGDRYRMCETIYIDEVSCLSREIRDCNYRTVIYSDKYIGCFYCRPRCESDFNCRDLNRVCSLARKIQPVKACTEAIYRHVPSKTYYNFYTNPSNLNWLMSYLPPRY